MVSYYNSHHFAVFRINFSVFRISVFLKKMKKNLSRLAPVHELVQLAGKAEELANTRKSQARHLSLRGTGDCQMDMGIWITSESESIKYRYQ